MFTDSHDRALSFDLDRRGQIRGHATYATARAAVLLAASAPGADRTQLARIDDVTEFHL